MNQARILLVEDEPISARFMIEALTDLAHIDWACSLDAAKHALSQHRFQLLLCDRQLPDGRGESLLATLQADPAQRNHAVPALALSAELDDSDRAELQAMGFAACLNKPIAADALRQAVRAWLGSRAAVWDDAAAASALGRNPNAIIQLRRMMQNDLDLQRQSVEAAFRLADLPRLNAELHRLSSACGFCGAQSLQSTITALRAAPGEATLAAFSAACDALLEADPAALRL